jgi:AraC-like DNA-binding protein
MRERLRLLARASHRGSFGRCDWNAIRIVELTDAQALETSIVENLQRRDVHPLDEAAGYVSLLHLAYTVEQIAAMCGKSPSYVAGLCGRAHKAAYAANLLMWGSGVALDGGWLELRGLRAELPLTSRLAGVFFCNVRRHRFGRDSKC